MVDVHLWKKKLLKQALIKRDHLEKVLDVVLGLFPPDPLPLSLSPPPFSDLPLSRTCGLWSLLLSESWFWFWFWLDPVPLSVSCELWFCPDDGLDWPGFLPLSMFKSSFAI